MTRLLLMAVVVAVAICGWSLAVAAGQPIPVKHDEDDWLN